MQKNSTNLIEYDIWSTEKMALSLHKISNNDFHKIIPIPFFSLQGHLSHIINYEKKFLIKEYGYQNTSITKYSKKQILDLLMNNIDLKKEYINIDLDDSLIKMVMHSIYHRGQINASINFLGYEAYSLDIFLYLNNC